MYGILSLKKSRKEKNKQENLAQIFIFYSLCFL